MSTHGTPVFRRPGLELWDADHVDWYGEAISTDDFFGRMADDIIGGRGRKAADRAQRHGPSLPSVTEER